MNRIKYSSSLLSFSEYSSLISESLEKIPSNGSDPDDTAFENHDLHYTKAFGPFAFIGEGNGVLTYIKGKFNTHFDIFSTIKNAYSNDSLITNKALISVEPISQDIIKYFVKKQSKIHGNARVPTRAGRIWKNIKSEVLGKKVDVVAFWVKESKVKKSDLAAIKKTFKSKNFYWVGTDSKYFNLYGDKVKETGGTDTKEIRSKLVPPPTWAEIGEALVQQHLNRLDLTARQKAIIAEYPMYGKKTGDIDIDTETKKKLAELQKEVDARIAKKLTGGFGSAAEKHSREKTSESVENIENS